MVEKLVFHIGDHKTGSTAIQTTLASGRFDVGVRSVFYPTKFNHNNLVKKFKNHGNLTTVGKRNREQLKELADSIRRSNDTLCVLSGEVFENLNPAKLADTVEEFFADCAQRVEVLAYVRPHAARIVSSFAEQTKIGWFQGSLEKFAENNMKSGRFEYAPRFAKLAKRFGDRFTLRPMIRANLYSGSVVDDFFHQVLGDADFSLKPGPGGNESLSLEDLALIRMMQARLQDFPRWTRHAYGWQFSRTLAKHKTAGTAPAMHNDLALRVQAHFRQDAQVMDRTFFGSQPILEDQLQANVDKAVAHPQSIRAEDFFTASECNRVAALAEMNAILMSRDDKEGEGWRKYFRTLGLEEISGE